MKTLLRLGSVLLLFIAMSLGMVQPKAWAVGPDEETVGGLSAPAMTRLTVTQRQMAKLLGNAKLALDSGTPSTEVAQKFYAEVAKLNLPNPMVELNRLKSRLTEVGLDEAALGSKFDGGGTPVEMSLLVYRRELTLDCIREAIREVARVHGEKVGKVFLAKIGKWAVQSPDKFTLAGDIDFSFVGANPEVLLALRDAFNRIITERTGMSMVAIDSVATAHGFAEHMVYMGIQGRKFADDAMMAMLEGVERVNMADPDATGTPRAQAVAGEQALDETIIEETVRKYRAEGLEAKGLEMATELEKAWTDRRSQTVEPMLSMEMARHLEADIIRNVDVFAAIDIVKKGAKYLRRSNEQTKLDLKAPTADETWEKFVFDVDELAKKAKTEEIVEFIDKQLVSLGATEMFEKVMVDGKRTLVAKPGGAEAFLAKTKSLIWGNVANGLDVRIKLLADGINNRGESFGPGTPDDLRPERISDTLKMLAAGLEVMKHDKSQIPPEIQQKMGAMAALLEGYGNKRNFSLPQAEIDKIKEVLREAAANENSLRLKMAIVADHVDKWIVKNYDTMAEKLPDSVKQKMTVADAKVDALNSVLDWVDATTLGSLRDRGVLEIDLGKGADGKAVVKSLKFPSVAAYNRRLNESVLGKVANNSAFKAFNLYEEGDAYYSALMASNTPMEAFRNVGYEIFRRRFPGGGAIEAAAMGNYIRVSVEVVYLLYPPLAIPEGLYGIAAATSDKYNSWYWSSSLEVYVDGLYKGTVFKDLGDSVPVGGRRYVLESIETKSDFGLVSVALRAEIENGRALFLRDPTFNMILWKNLGENDPFILLMEEMKKHEAAGERVRQAFQNQLNEHWDKVKTDFAKNTIDRLEKRRASEEALSNGEAVKHFTELKGIADELEISDPLFAAMDEKWDSGPMMKFWVWLKTAKRLGTGEALPEKENVRAVTILREYVEEYRKVRDARIGAEGALATIFRDAGLEPLPERRDLRRLLTGLVFLECVPDKDTAQAASIRAIPGAAFERVNTLLDEVISREAPGVAREPEYDKIIAARITGEQVWAVALKRARAPVFAAGTLAGAIKAHEDAAGKLLAEFTAHYAGKAGSLLISVRQVVGGKETTQPVTNAKVSLVELSSGDDLTGKLRDAGDGSFQVLGLKEGKYRISAKAEGFTALKGAGVLAVIEHVLTKDAASRRATLWLKPLTGAEGLQAFIDSKPKPPLLFTSGKDNTSAELTATVVGKPDSGKFTYQWSTGDEVLDTGVGLTRQTFSAVGRKPGEHLVRLYVEDEKKREGTAEIKITVMDGAALKVSFGEHAAEIFKDQDATISVVEPKPAPGSGLIYRWTVKDQDGKQLLDMDWGDRFLINGAYYADKKLDIAVLVQDGAGRSGAAATKLTVRADEQPEKLSVTLEPAKGMVVVGAKLAMRAWATAFPDSGKIQFSWDDGKTWVDSDQSEIVGEEREVGITLSVSVHARDAKKRTGVATAFIGVERGKPVGKDIGLKISAKEPFYKIGDWIGFNLEYDKTRYINRCEWSGAFKGDTLYPSFKADKSGTLPLTLTVYETGDDTVERLIGTATCSIVVLKPSTIKAPATMNATDIGHASLEIPGELAPYVKRINWWTDKILGDKAWGEEGREIDFQYSNRSIPSDDTDGKKTYRPVALGATLYDENNRELERTEIPIVVKPVGFSAAGSNAWVGSADLNGLNLERKKATRTRSEGGKEVVSANATARISVKWMDSFAPDNDEEMRKSVESAAVWRSLPSPTGAQNYKLVTEAFSVGDFKGYIQKSQGVATRYNGSQYVDLCFPQAGAGGYGILRKGKLFLVVSYSAGGDGMGFGEGKLWYDDMPFCKQQTESALGEILGILGGLKMGPDPAYSASPYKGPALDGSDTPRVLSIKLSGPDKLRPGQLGTVSAAVDGGAAPYAYEWSGDHGGSGTSVTVVSRKAGDLKLTLTVRDGAGGSASETITIKVDAVNPPIVGMPAEPVYGTSADLSVTLPAGGKFRVVWQSSPELKFDPVESSDGKTRLTFNRAPSDGVKIWTQILDESGQTSGESPQLTSKVKAPAMVLKVPPEAVKLGSEVPVSVELTPAIEASLIGFRWLEPATSFFKQDSGNGSRIAVSPRAVGPLNLLVEAYVPGTEDILGQLKGSITGAGFGLKARVVEPGTRPMIWKEGVGLVPVPKNTYAGDELVTVEVDFEGEAPKGDVRWAWTANEGTTISGSTSRTPTVSRHETGTASLNVTARNADGVQLGATSCSFQVSVPASEVTKALQPSVVIRPENPAPRTGENLELSAEVARGTAPYTYSWSGVTGSGPRVNFKASKPGRTQVSVTVTDAKGKTASASVALEAVLGDKDKARQEAERLAAEAREAARRGDFDAAVRALDAARAASRDAAEIVKAAAREVATAARTAASTAERKRDFDTAEKLYGAAAKADPTDPTAARSIATLATYRQAMEKLRASQRETDTALDTRDLDLASDKLADVRKAESSLPGAQSPETTDLSQKLARAVSAYQTEVGPKRSAVLTAFNGGKYEESKRLLDALVQSRPLRKEDAAWARSLAEQIKQRLRQATTTAQKAEVKSPQDKVSSSSSSTSSVRPVATSSLPAGASIRLSTTSVRATSTVPAMNPVSSLPTSSAMASQDPSSSATKSGGPALISLPQVQGHGGNFSAGLASLWVPSSAAGGDYSRHARMEGGVFVVDVPPGNGWAKAGLISKEPSFIMDDQPLAVKLSLDPDRTSGFGVAFAPGAHQEAWGTNNVWFTWVRPAAQVHSEFWFGNSAEPADGRASDFMAGRAPEELIFVLRPGLAEVHLPDGRVFTMRPSWLRKGTPVYTHVFSHAQLNQLPAKLALRSLTWGPVPSLPAPVQSVPALGIRPLWTGELPPVWTSLQAVGGDFSRFGRVERGQLVVDVPAGNSWGKTGICSPERLFTIGERPVNIVVRFDPARTSGYVVAFAPNMHQDVWGSSNVWFSYTRSSSQVHGDIWFGNSQGDVDQRVTEQVSGVAPYELVFSLSPGRAEVRLPDGRVRVIKSSWLLKDTPVYGHVFTHPNEHHLSSKLALTDFTVGVGEMPARKAPPALATQTDTGLRTLWTGEVGGLWAPLSAAGGDYTKHARLVGKALVVDAPAGNGWAKAGVYTPERILTIGDKPFTVTVRLDPSRSTGYCVAFAPVWHQDVWGAGNAWFSWVSPDSAKENVFGGNSQNADDTRFSGTSPAAAPPGTMQFVFRGGGGGLECRFSDGTVRSHNFSWMKKGTPVYLHIFAHAPAHGLPARMTLLGVEVQSELVWPPVH